jgi:hypothetical protein
LPAAEPDAALSEALWLRVQVAARILHRRDRDGLVLRHSDGRSAVVVDGPAPVVVTGEPAELMVWVYRAGSADVVIA